MEINKLKKVSKEMPGEGEVFTICGVEYKWKYYNNNIWAYKLFKNQRGTWVFTTHDSTKEKLEDQIRRNIGVIEDGE